MVGEVVHLRTTWVASAETAVIKQEVERMEKAEHEQESYASREGAV